MVAGRVTIEEALKLTGKEAVSYHARLTGASNRRAKAQFGFAPRALLWHPREIELFIGRLAKTEASGFLSKFEYWERLANCLLQENEIGVCKYF
ncbi:hypothetical protein [Methylobacterium segetis]|uniref:hypothetical protein n=1 Tax=Methylobacterium segetis TaxID=2488750 RepID=UPI001FE11704|nr:hypothetical protein [Methylobacterium segetis]